MRQRADNRTGSSLDMTSGNAFSLILKYSIPLLCGNMLQQFYNMVDSYVVGNYATQGDLALAAVGNGGPITFLMAAMFIGLSGGVTVLVAQLFGAGDRAGIKKAADTAYSLIIPVGLGLAIIFVLCLKKLLALMAIPEEIYKDTYRYTVICMACVIGPMGYNINSGIMQGMGDTRTPLILLLCSTLINVVLDLLFVVAFHWDAMGVALATVIAQFISWIVGIFLINKHYGSFLKVTPFIFKVNTVMLKEILRIGIPSSIQMMSISFGNVLIQRIINSNGTSFAAGAVCAHKIDSFIVLPCQSFSNSITTYIGQNLGANRMDRVKNGIVACLTCAIVSTAIFGSLTYLFAEKLIGFFNDNPTVIKYGAEYLKILMPFYPILTLMFTYCGVLRGMRKVLVTMVAMISAQCILRVLFSIIFNNIFGGSAIYYSFPVGWSAGAAIVMCYYYFGNWRKTIRSFSADHADA